MEVSPNNLLRLDYQQEAQHFRSYPFPLIDVHTHINDLDAAQIFKQVIDLYGVGLVYSMTSFNQLSSIKKIFGNMIRFIAIPDYRSGDLFYNVGAGYIERIKLLHKQGVRIVKFWAAPRSIDLASQAGYPGVLSLAATHIHEVMEVAQDLGMVFMVHVADPDLWFKNKYSDDQIYGSKEDQYQWFEKLIDRFDNPWIAAHFGGWPEDLSFLSSLLERHDNLYIDSSATKWMVRELSRYSQEEVISFLRKWQGKVLFGSDIVTKAEHLRGERSKAFELYAFRYWTLRTFFETDYTGQSPIADSDFQEHAPGNGPAPIIQGKQLPIDVLRSLYFEAADNLLEPYHQEQFECPH